MGTPAFPDLGKHCSVDDCRQLDFLPFTCDCCQQVFCLDHRSYSRHQCPKANKNDHTVVICPLCAKGVHLIPQEDPNITWESHVNIDCDPSNYEIATKKRKCPVPRCRETLTFSNTIKCRDCNIDHCLKHRFGPDHNCPGPKKPEPTFQFLNFLNRTGKEDTIKQEIATSSSPSSNWSLAFTKIASTFRATAEAGVNKLSSEFNQVLRTNGTLSQNNSENGNDRIEICPHCNLRFGKVGDLVDHVEKIHHKNEVMNMTINVCPKCSKGFRDPNSLVAHLDKEHRGVSTK
ncbi:zinc finger AN1 and C2H2 domain-containing stress-associated protein 13-like [Andrographis paniculata]|uniref:zinc finger AN1 and C2H2 domain-containing stress-associated protein 13-like n=1 Tax=Andrographis paniculata TaxID=175694 RepID=UPI0021E747EB|nr:zinc finger AN1 and C2H2 domain-containing stress-associated protein 13-like [Andrographis paniculata]XP_051138897.1 zinc finger AN1 and C2H2 domain-containing stress-associated protein 13-like [Andrographis paniculata]XP_051138898.1 zinc finger AN1 and C2H2 domain-containing stress-associated protein 13-like [Andrographis paniculata]XP_051138899.1 zinc finger AN1 and C2H2 domain-containing stress-associated protein 13-like [Andrographis paniculata]XP_051138900.1 zinc finger AN1 and C2H2 dom